MLDPETITGILRGDSPGKSSPSSPSISRKEVRTTRTRNGTYNKETGNREAFHNVAAAYRVLCDPVRRAAYDRDTFDTSSPQHERDLRRQLLQTLYNVRRTEPHRPSLPLMVIPDLFGCSIDEAQFTLWYLRGKKFIEMTDDGMAITVAGVDYVESHELGLATGTPPDPALGPGSFMLGAGD